jgi:hypothetical protein
VTLSLSSGQWRVPIISRNNAFSYQLYRSFLVVWANYFTKRVTGWIAITVQFVWRLFRNFLCYFKTI